MSDAEGNPMEETEPSEETEEEEENQDFEEIENPKEYDTAGEESQEGEEEEGEEGEEMEGVEEEEERVQEEQIENEQAEEQIEEEQIEEGQVEEGQVEEGEIEEGQTEEGQIEEEQLEGKGERREDRWKEREEKEEEVEEITGELQSITSLQEAIANLQFISHVSLDTDDPQLVESLRSGQTGPSELLDLGSQSEMFTSDQFPSEGEHMDSQRSSQSQFPQEPERKDTEEMLDQERRVSEPKKGSMVSKMEEGKPKRLSYFLSEEQEKEFQIRARGSKDSLVSSSTEDSLFQKQEATSVYPLTLTWSYGWNSSLPVLYLRDENRRVLLYVCGHTAVLFDVFCNAQHHLQGHSNIITCLCISEDRRWIATADKGPGCLIIIWDSFSGIPVHTIFDSCPQSNGIRTIAITRDAKYLATISDAEIQQVCIWRWTLAVEKPACTLELPRDYGFQNHLIFNPTNNRELVSNSRTQTIYYFWLEHKNILVHSAPILTEKTFNKLVGKFSQSVFHLNLTQILSATLEGKMVVWDIQRPHSLASGLPYLKPCKLVHLQKEGITVLTTVDSYIVTGDIKGNIKFYDHTLSVLNWYSNFKLSSIKALSFSKSPPKSPTETSNLPSDCTLKGDLFVVRNFIIATCDATVYHLTAEGTKLEKLFVEPKDAICAIACHPYQPLLAIGSTCGMIKMWDYEKKKYLFSRVFEKGLGVQSLTYNPEGALLGAGFTEGTVYILDAMSLKNESEPFHYSRSSVTHVSFSHDSRYMATADVSFTVAVYMMIVQDGQRVWQYLARIRSHRKSIQSLLFGVHLDSNEPRLLSLGRDRFLIEYNLTRSLKNHLEVLDIHRTDQGTYPTCMVWYPPLTKELFLLMCNSGYKVKLFNATTKMCRKTLLGPAYGSPIEYTQVLPVKDTLDLLKRYLVFINKDKVGLQILPIDGNPHKTCAIICHPSGVAGLALSHDGHYAFTAGGQDRSVVQWKINLHALDAAVSLGGEDLIPFYGLVSGGREGKFYRELEDYFYYSQLRCQGIDTMETRKVSEYIHLSELPFVMRAIGFYPSEEAIDDMFNEIKFSEYVETGMLIDKINLPDFFKVYLNHRPPFGNTMSSIQHSFDVLGYTNSQGEKAIRREDFLRLLLTRGEHMTEEEMSDCFATLYGLNPEGWKSEPAASSVTGSEICYEEELPDEITAEIFTTDILGLTISDNSGQQDQ